MYHQSPISVPQENQVPDALKSAPPTEGSDQPGPTNKYDNSKPTQSKPADHSKRLKLNSPHSNQENKAPGFPKSAPPTDVSHNPATKLDKSKPTQSKPADPTKERKRSKLVEYSSSHPAYEDKPLQPISKPAATPPAERLKLNINTHWNALFSDKDQTTLLSGDWLSDKHINAAHKLMAQKFPSQHGLQDTLILDKCDLYRSSNEDFVQVINVAGKHWICASNRFSPPGMVYVYDSLPSCSINSSSLHRQIATIMKAEDAAFIVKHVDVQRQLGSSDCGLMAIAFAASLCSGLDPHTLKYDQSKLRSDFLSGIESGCLLPFHIPGATRRFGRAYFIHVKEVPVFCICRLPWNKANSNAHIVRGALVQCAVCKEWHHQFCCKIDDVVIDTPKYKYLCRKCTELQ